MFYKISRNILRQCMFLIFLFISMNVFSQQTITEWMNTAQERIDTLRKGNFTIKVFDKNGVAVSDSIEIKLKKHEFVFGCANDFDRNNYSSDPAIPSTNDWIQSTILKYFNMNVTGNAFKWSGTQPYSSTSYNYGPVDSVVNWGWRENIDLKGHNLIWGANNDSDYHCIPKWAMELPTNQDLYNACKTRVQTMAQRYKGKFKEYDVINEPLHATWLINRLGTDSIYWNAFKWVREIDTTTKLYINEYNVEYNWGDAAKYKTLIQKMLSKGAPIDGIGVQAHFWFTTIDLGELKQNMDILATLGLPIRFTEFDLAQMSQERQASYTSSIFRFAFSYPAIEGIISWALWDAGAWRTESGYFDADKVPKIAADTIYKLIHKVWTTNINTNFTDSVKFNGYYGQYDVKVKFGDTWKQFSIDCNKLHNDSVFVLNEQNGAVPPPQFDTAYLKKINRLYVKFDKKMADPASSIRDFKLFQISPIKIDSVSLLPEDSSVVVMYLGSSVNNNYMTVSYSDGTMRSADGGMLEAFGPEAIATDYATCTAASTTTDGKEVELKFNKQMADPSSELAYFTIKVNNVAVSLDSVRLKDGNDSIMVFSLTNLVNRTHTLLISYTGNTITSKDGQELASFNNFPVSNIVPNLSIVSAGTSTDGKTFEVRFTLPMNDPFDQLSRFLLTANNVHVDIDSVWLKENNDSILVFSLPNPIKIGDLVNISYFEGTVSAKERSKVTDISEI